MDIYKTVIVHRIINNVENRKKSYRQFERKAKIIFNYLRRQRDRNIKIRHFKRDKDYICSVKEICKMLNEQRDSQFFERNEGLKVTIQNKNDIFMKLVIEALNRAHMS